MTEAHPAYMQVLEGGPPLVPNDVSLGVGKDAKHGCLIVSGPNMGGKSRSDQVMIIHRPIHRVTSAQPLLFVLVGLQLCTDGGAAVDHGPARLLRPC